MSLIDTSIRNAKPKDKPCKLADSQGLYLLVNSEPRHSPDGYNRRTNNMELNLGAPRKFSAGS